MKRPDSLPPILPILMGVGVALVTLFLSARARVPALPASQDPLVQNMDSAAKPGDDFFRYACGRWIDKNPIPASERRWGIGNLVDEEIYRQLVEICEQAATSHPEMGSSAQKVGDFWATGLDSANAEALGAAPLEPFLRKIAMIDSPDALLESIAQLHVYRMSPLYRLSVDLDERNSDRYRVHLYQGGMGLPDRDYYFDPDSSSRAVRDAYGPHVTAVFRLLGDDDATARRGADAVLRIETALARRARTLEQRRDPWANYNVMSLADLGRLTPHIDWRKQLATMGVYRVDTVIVGPPEFLAAGDSLLSVFPLADWKSYLRWTVTRHLDDKLSRAFGDENFRFYGTVMSGTPTQRPRWKRVLDAEEDAIGELMGQEWVKRYCPPSVKARYTRLTADIIAVYRDRMRALPWMSEATRKRALAKLEHVGRKVAYPDHWRDYSELKLDRTSYAGNQVKVDAWWFHFEAEKLHDPVDRTEWDMTPQTYNAYYDPSKVEIVLPAAAFLLPGVPDSLVDDAVLYGYAGGSTIGHEITHGFDDEGRQADEKGNLNPWWTVQDSVAFTLRAQRLVKQFDDYVVAGKHVRGQATLGENLADLGGVRLGYEAFKKTEQWKKGEKLNGLTPDQRYFLGYALSWLGHRRPQSLANQIMTDVHAPGFLRVNGPLANIPEFYKAFGIKPGDAMWRPDSLRAEVW